MAEEVKKETPVKKTGVVIPKGFGKYKVVKPIIGARGEIRSGVHLFEKSKVSVLVARGNLKEIG